MKSNSIMDDNYFDYITKLMKKKEKEKKKHWWRCLQFSSTRMASLLERNGGRQKTNFKSILYI
jgi:CRISPR/Cas system CSM-associated protein Csm2 small subunit